MNITSINKKPSKINPSHSNFIYICLCQISHKKNMFTFRSPKILKKKLFFPYFRMSTVTFYFNSKRPTKFRHSYICVRRFEGKIIWTKYKMIHLQIHVFCGCFPNFPWCGVTRRPSQAYSYIVAYKSHCIDSLKNSHIKLIRVKH